MGVGPTLVSNLEQSRAERALVRARREQVRQRMMIRLLLLSTLFASLAALVGLRAPRMPSRLPSTTDPPVGLESGSGQDGNIVRLVDGSTVALKGSSSSVVVRELGVDRIVVELERGAGIFSVASRPERAFVVRAGPADLTVTQGEVEVDLKGSQTWVSVAQGLARVDWAHASATLGAGTHGLFPP